jgi:hypothetical protein
MGQRKREKEMLFPKRLDNERTTHISFQGVEKRAKETLRLSCKVIDLPSLAIQICLGEQIAKKELCPGLRKRRGRGNPLI